MEKCPKDIGDMEIFDVVKKLNSSPFVQTSMSCAGHDKYGYPYIEIERPHRTIEGVFAEVLTKKINKNIPGTRLAATLDENAHDPYRRIAARLDGGRMILRKDQREIFWDAFRKAIKEMEKLPFFYGKNIGKRSYFEVLKEAEEYNDSI